MKVKSVLLAAAFVGGSIVGASAQSSMNPTPSGAQRDPTISSATHCMDKTTGQARMRQAPTTGTAATGQVGIQDKSARSSGASSQTPANAGTGGVKLSDC